MTNPPAARGTYKGRFSGGADDAVRLSQFPVVVASPDPAYVLFVLSQSYSPREFVEYAFSWG